MDIRTFISIPIQVNDRISELLDDLSEVRNVRVPPAEQVHMTLCFIGDVDTRLIGVIRKCVEDTIKDLHKSDLELEGIGTFPVRKEPRVVWIDVKTSFPLKELAENIKSRLKEEGIAHDDKPFVPHVTVGRISGRTNIDNIIEKYSDCRFGVMDFDSVKIMKSEFHDRRVVHKVLESVDFNH